MKTNFRHLLLVAALCSTLALSATDYVMLSPLDTAALPAIPNKDGGGNIVHKALVKVKTAVFMLFQDDGNGSQVYIIVNLHGFRLLLY